MVIFDEKKHRYINSETGKELISVTRLIGKYKPPFDKKEAATRVANREGLTVDFVLDLWDKEKNRACDYGTDIHKVMEDYLVEGKKDKQFKSLYDSYNKWKKIFKGFPNLKCEEQVYNVDINIAGTSDLIYENKTHFYIGDFKTNKAFRFISDYNEFFKSPIDHLSVCEFNTYGLQLSLYAFLYEKMSKKKCNGLVIFYKNKENETWYPIRLNYLKSEIIDLIDDYNNPNSLSSKIA